MGFRRTAAVALGFTLGALLGSGQVSIPHRSKRPDSDPAIPSANLRVDTSLVLVPVTVNDELNHPITGLEKGNFQIFDEKMEQSIRAFSTEDEPIALGFVFDTSGSMRNALPAGREAAEQFLKLANPEDEFFLVEFDSAPRLSIPLTSDTGRVGTKILMTKSGGSTALIDALYLAIHEIWKSNKTKKALVLISDGGENNSRYTAAEIKNVVRETDVLIYTVAVGGGYSGADEMYGRSLMNQIAEMTGAHMYVAGPYDLPDIAQKIGIELRNRYVLGYSPRDQQRDGRYHRIVVKVNPPRGLPKLRAHWRLGYYAPSD